MASAPIPPRQVEKAYRRIDDPQFQHDARAFVLLLGGRASAALASELTPIVSRGKSVVPMLKDPDTAWRGGSLLGGLESMQWLERHEVDGVFEEDAREAGERRLRGIVQRYFRL